VAYCLWEGIACIGGTGDDAAFSKFDGNAKVLTLGDQECLARQHNSQLTNSVPYVYESIGPERE
jgi:hypothetical protein